MTLKVFIGVVLVHPPALEQPGPLPKEPGPVPFERSVRAETRTPCSRIAARLHIPAVRLSKLVRLVLPLVAASAAVALSATPARATIVERVVAVIGERP